MSCTKPRGAIYLFPRLDPDVYKIRDDEKLVLDFLVQERVLFVQGTAFNLPTPDHVRLVFLPRKDDLEHAIDAFADFLQHYEQ